MYRDFTSLLFLNLLVINFFLLSLVKRSLFVPKKNHESHLLKKTEPSVFPFIFPERNHDRLFLLNFTVDKETVTK